MIKVKNVSVSYAKKYYLKDISFEINEGESIGIMGPTGVGKTTLLRLLANLDSPSSGQITKSGDIKCSFVFQNTPLLTNKTVLQNVLLPISKPKLYVREAKDILTSVGLIECINKYPSQLSGGQKQRLGLARALITKPNVLFLDEPTSALDEAIGVEILQLISEIKQKNNLTLVVVTHDINVARFLCDWVLWLEDGAIIKDGLVKKMSNYTYDHNLYWADLYE